MRIVGLVFILLLGMCLLGCGADDSTAVPPEMPELTYSGETVNIGGYDVPAEEYYMLLIDGKTPEQAEEIIIKQIRRSASSEDSKP